MRFRAKPVSRRPHRNRTNSRQGIRHYRALMCWLLLFGAIFALALIVVLVVLFHSSSPRDSREAESLSGGRSADELEALKEREREAVKASEAAEVLGRKAVLLGREKLSDEEREQLQKQEERGHEKPSDNTVICPKCMMKIHRDATICPYCRTSFETAYSCGNCGMAISRYARVCPYCRADFRPWYDRD